MSGSNQPPSRQPSSNVVETGDFRHRERYKAGVRAAITWLHARACEMNDRHARGILDSAAANLGWDLAANRLKGATAPEPTSSTLPPESIDELQVRRIVSEIERITTGRRPIDIAQSLLDVLGREIAADAATPEAAWHQSQLVAKRLMSCVRDRFAERQTHEGAP